MPRSVIVTGGSGGLGTAVTRTLLDGGWRVIVPIKSGRDRQRLPEHASLHPVEADLLDPAAVSRMVDFAAAEEEAAPLGAVVNLVGGFKAGSRVHETPVEEFEDLLRLNLRPTFLTCQASIPALRDAGGGAMVCVSARAALRPFSGGAAYAVAKAAVLTLVDALAVEYRDDGIRANAILPSVIDTPANRAAMPDSDASKWVKPEQIASVVRFLCEDGSGVVSGAHVPVYGRA